LCGISAGSFLDLSVSPSIHVYTVRRATWCCRTASRTLIQFSFWTSIQVIGAAFSEVTMHMFATFMGMDTIGADGYGRARRLIMITQKEIRSFFGDAPVIGVSDTAGLLNVDETVVRRWCRENDIYRLGPNFALGPAEVAELAAALEDEDLDDGEEDDGDVDDEDDEDDGEEDDDDDDQ
jgi:hypothetical protein